MVCSAVMQWWRWHPKPFHNTLLYYKVLSFVMVEMAPNPLQNHYMIVYCTQLTYTLLSYTIMYYTTVYYTMLAVLWYALLWCNGGDGIPIPSTTLCCTKMYYLCNGGDGTQSLTRSLYDTISYSSDIYHTILSYTILYYMTLHYTILWWLYYGMLCCDAMVEIASQSLPLRSAVL